MTPELELKAHNNKRHYTKVQAKKVLKQLMSRRKEFKGKQQSIYKCRVCGKWQITSKPKQMQY